MRTTLNVDDELMARVRRRAEATGKTITEIVEQALRAEVAGARPGREHFALRWKPVRGRPLPGVDLADRDSLYELMEANE